MFDWTLDLMEVMGPPGVVFLMFLENLFPPIPSEVVMPMAGFMAARGSVSLWVVLLSGTVGSVVGATIWYEAARALGEKRFMALIDRYGLWLTLTREEAEMAIAWFRRWGSWAVFLGRCVPAIRTLISVPAAVAGMPRGPFLVLTTLGSFAWVSFLAGAGYLLEAEYHRVEEWLNPVSTVVIIGFVVIYVWRVWRQLRRRRQRA